MLSLRTFQPFRSLIVPAVTGFILLTYQPAVLSQQSDWETVVEESTSEVPIPIVPTNETSYRLGAGDRIYMDVFNLPDYSREYQVLSGGTLNLPLIGSVYVKGMTLQESASEVTTLYRRYIRQPVVTVSLVSSRPIQLAVVGQVNRPGAYTVPPENQAPNLSQAIDLAGGITESADVRNVEIHRPDPQNSGTIWVRKVNLWDLLAGDLSQNITLQDGDTVSISTATALSPSEASDLAAATFSPENITVNVVGEATTPGPVKVSPNTPLNQVLLASGGFSNRAETDYVQLVRLNKNGTVSNRRIEVDFMQDPNEETNPILRDNDAVIIERSDIAEFGDRTNQVFNPLSGFLGLVRIILGF